MYYDGIAHRQNSELLVPCTTVFRLLAQSLGIKVPKGFKIVFRPLWQLTEEQKASTASAVTATIKEAHESGIVSQKTAMQELKQSSTVTGVWTNITQEDIDAAEEELPPGPGELEQAAMEQNAEQADESDSAGATRPKRKTKDAEGPEFPIGTKVRPSNRVQMNLQVPIDTQTWHITQANKLRVLLDPGNKAFGVRPKYGTSYRYEITSSSGVRGWADPEQLTKDSKDNMFKTVFGMAYFHDLYPVIESPKGSERGGGTLAADYGYLPRHTGADGDQIDVFVGEHPEVDTVYIIDQAKPVVNGHGKQFDEHKVILGARSGEEAMDFYVTSYDHDPTEQVMAMNEMPMKQFKQWLESGDLKRPYSEQIV